jgi:VIT1/CCC1 family predicted Fe2+/Mn2+ transporter
LELVLPQTPHIERHFRSSAVVRDMAIGMADGLTVPFALAAGLSGAVDSSWIVITAGLAEIAAGAIAMGLGGYLAAKTDAEHFKSERDREERETMEIPEQEAREVEDIFRRYGLKDQSLAQVVSAIREDRGRWIDFMMKFELGIEAPKPKRARQSALTIATAYALGGFIPLTPYFWLAPKDSLPISAACTLTALGVFGYVKSRLTTLNPWRGAIQTMFVGALAAVTAYLIALFLT